MTIVDVLKEIVTSLGGSYAASDDTVSELLAKVNAAFEDGNITAPISINGTLGTNESNKETVTFDKTAAALYDAVKSGIMCKVTISVTEEEITTTINVITAITAVKAESGDTTFYNFFFKGGDGKDFAVEELGGEDTVVLTEV